MSASSGHLDPDERRHINVSRSGAGLLVAGLVVLVAVYLLARGSDGGLRRFWLAYVHNYAFCLSLSLGALFFVLLQHVTRSGWSVVVRRLAEVMAANLIVLAVLFVPIAAVVLGGSGIPYPWARPLSELQQPDGTHARASDGLPAGATGGLPASASSPPTHEHAARPEHAGVDAGGHEVSLLLKKRPWLNPPFFVIRWVVYFAVWAGAAYWFWKRSVRQDASGDVGLTLSMQTLSAPVLLAFALTVTLASFDLLMSLDPIWFSTIFGVYFFSGCVVGFFALIIVTLASLQSRGVLAASVNAEHYHDLGKLLFGFVFFWGYIAFSQYMLIWYGNIPEETGWFFRRGVAIQAPNAWSYVILFILFGHFVVPFVVLLSRDVKRRRKLLTFWALWMLGLHWIDLYWLVMPEFTTAYLPMGVPEIGCLLGLGLIFAAGLAWWATGRSLVPLQDPRLTESLAFRNL